MLENPCFLISLQTGAKVIAALDILLAVIPLAIVLSGVIPGYRESRTAIIEDTVVSDGIDSTTGLGNSTGSIHNVIGLEREYYFDMGIWTIMIFFVVVDIAVSYILFTGSKNRHLKKLKTWFYIRSVTLVLTIILVMTSICLGSTFKIVVYDFFHTIYRIYTLWVIHALIQEIVTENRRLYNSTYYTQTNGRAPPSIIVTSDNTANNSHANGDSKFGFDNIAYS